MSKLVRIFLVGCLVAVFLVHCTRNAGSAHSRVTVAAPNQIAQALESSLEKQEFPATLEIPDASFVRTLTVRYTLDPTLQQEMETLLRRYKPDYGAVVALDPRTGKILALTSFTRSQLPWGNLALKSFFPAASIFKIVTAAAAIDQGRMNAETQLAYTGSNHTLYRRNLTQLSPKRWARQVTLKEAFAHSINTVFGKIGLYLVDPSEIAAYAERFYFNRSVDSDFLFDTGQFFLPHEDKYAIAEIASGFNRMTTLSPVQGAMMVGALLNEGLMMTPYLIESADTATEPFYRGEPRPLQAVLDPQTARQLQTLMTETVRSGTSKRSFRDLLRKKLFANVDIGGKTGSLVGLTPEGKCDWFVGYGRRGKRSLAIAAITVNKDQWQVKSAFLASRAIETYLEGPKPSRPQVRK